MIIVMVIGWRLTILELGSALVVAIAVDKDWAGDSPWSPLRAGEVLDVTQTLWLILFDSISLQKMTLKPSD